MTQSTIASSFESALFAIEGFRGVSRYLLVFTDRRLIIASVRRGAKRLATLATFGLVELAHEELRAKKMKEKEIEELLSDKETYIIPYDEINSIEVVKGGMFLNGLITVYRTVGKPEKFRVYIKKRIDNFERLLKPVFGERLVVKR